MAELDEERRAALRTAAEAKAEAAQLAETRQRLVWQSRLLEKMSEVSAWGGQGGGEWPLGCMHPN